jgi:hypothetical protein
MLKDLLNNPGKFKYYGGGKGSTSTPLTFGQKTIPFGNDRPGGGNSNQPYIISTIPKDITSNSPDFLNRGGDKYLNIVKDNVSRLKQFLDPKNPLSQNFITKQNLLFQQQSKLPFSIYPNLSYTTTNLLLNTSEPNMGIHFGGKGNDPLGVFVSTNKYIYQTFNYYNKDDSNRLMLLYGTKLGNKSKVKGRLSDFNINTLSKDTLFSYVIGPNGPLTNYKRSVNTTNWSNSSDYKNTFLVWDPQTLIDVGDNRVYSKTKSQFTDFRKFLPTPNTNSVAYKNNTSTDYIFWNRTIKYGLGDPGKSLLDRNNFSKGITSNGTPDFSTVDQVNFKPIYSSGSVDNTVKNQDLVPFYISVLNPDAPTQENFIHFRAFLDGGITDAFAAEWSDIKYMGRGEKFYKYNGFSREISLNFKVHVQSKYEQQIVYTKLNYLASLTAPNYGKSGVMRGNIIKLTIGDYLKETPGILKGFSFVIDENYPWDIGRDTSGNIDSNSNILPMIISVNSFQFTPVHSFLPELGSKFINTPLQTEPQTQGPTNSPPPELPPQSPLLTEETLNQRRNDFNTPIFGK